MKISKIVFIFFVCYSHNEANATAIAISSCITEKNTFFSQGEHIPACTKANLDNAYFFQDKCNVALTSISDEKTANATAKAINTQIIELQKFINYCEKQLDKNIKT